MPTIRLPTEWSRWPIKKAKNVPRQRRLHRKPRQIFIVALKDLKEIWELSYDPDADPIYGSFVHNYREGELEGEVVE